MAKAKKKKAVKKPAKKAAKKAIKKPAKKAMSTVPKKSPKRPKAKRAKASSDSTARSDALDWATSSGIKTASRQERAVIAQAMENHPMYAVTYAAVVKVYRESYRADPPESEQTILDTDPNGFDMDPSPFYEEVEELFGVPQDPNNQYFGGYGGPIRDLIAFLTPRWDGSLRR